MKMYTICLNQEEVQFGTQYAMNCPVELIATLSGVEYCEVPRNASLLTVSP